MENILETWIIFYLDWKDNMTFVTCKLKINNEIWENLMKNATYEKFKMTNENELYEFKKCEKSDEWMKKVKKWINCQSSLEWRTINIIIYILTINII